jgi:hypothetical protein
MADASFCGVLVAALLLLGEAGVAGERIGSEFQLRGWHRRLPDRRRGAELRFSVLERRNKGWRWPYRLC